MNNKKCPYCHSERVIRYGRRRTKNGTKQTYFCKDCHRKFTASAFKKPIFDSTLVGECLELYFRGISLRGICDFLLKTRNIKVSHPTVLKYLREGIKQVKEFTDSLVPITSATWFADETMFKCRDQPRNWAWNWNVLDEGTRFLITSRVSRTREQQDADELFKQANRHAGKEPFQLITDGLPQYVGASKRFLRRTRHEREISFQGTVNSNTIERYHGTFKGRHKTMRGFSRIDSSKILLDGFRIYYNFVRDHSALQNRTPAQAAQINLPKNCGWKELLDLSQENKVVVTNDNS